jgi:hypothetical protein
MKVQYGKDVASHSGPESCGGAREGAAEALTGETGGSAIEPRNHRSGTPTPLSNAEGNTDQGDTCESWDGPARSETLYTPGSFRHRSWEISTAPGATTSGSSGKAKSHTPEPPVVERSDALVVPGKPSNKGDNPAEMVEGRSAAKGTRNRFLHPGLGAGLVVRRRAWKAYVRRRAGNGGCNSQRSCITSRRSYLWTAFIASRRMRRLAWTE